MFCTSISGPDFESSKQQLQNVEFAEFRLDLIKANKGERLELYSISDRFIATCRLAEIGEDASFSLLGEAIRAGANYIDIEIERDEEYVGELIKLAHQEGCMVIISYHNYVETPAYRELAEVCNGAFQQGADLVKLACMVKQPKDNSSILALYKDFGNIVAFGMGKLGRVSRLASLYCGAAFTYVAADSGQATAPGQFTRSEMEQLLKETGGINE